MTSIASRARRPINLKEFADTGIPELVWRCDIICRESRQYILRMPVRVDGGDYAAPPELNWMYPAFVAARHHQQAMGLDHPFCYITVRHGIVTSQSDDEWHVDGFSTRVEHVPEQNYVWSSHTGTEYVPLNVNFPDDFDPLVHNVHTYLRQFVDPERVRSCRPGLLFCMDPYNLHRRPVATTGVMRTFVRISFVPTEINDINNTQNPLLPRTYNRDGVAHLMSLKEYHA